MAKRRAPRAGKLHVDDTPLEFDALEGGEAPQKQRLAIANAGSKTSVLRYAVSVDAKWLLVSPASGSLAQGEAAAVTVGVNVAGIAADVYEATLSVTNEDNPRDTTEILVTLTLFESSGEFFSTPFSASSSSSSCQPGPLRECREYAIQCPTPPFLGWPTDCASGGDLEVVAWREPRQHSIHNECQPCEWTMCPAPSGGVIYATGGSVDLLSGASALGRAAAVSRILGRSALLLSYLRLILPGIELKRVG